MGSLSERFCQNPILSAQIPRAPCGLFVASLYDSNGGTRAADGRTPSATAGIARGNDTVENIALEIRSWKLRH